MSNGKKEKAPILGDLWRQAVTLTGFDEKRLPALREFLANAKKDHNDSRFDTVMARPGPLAEGPEYLVALAFLFVDYTKSGKCNDRLTKVRSTISELRGKLPEAFRSAEVFALAEKSPQSVRVALWPPDEHMNSR